MTLRIKIGTDPFQFTPTEPPLQSQPYSRPPERRGGGAPRVGHQGRGAGAGLRDGVPAAAVSSVVLGSAGLGWVFGAYDVVRGACFDRGACARGGSLLFSPRLCPFLWSPPPSPQSINRSPYGCRETIEMMHMYPKKVEVIQSLEPLVEGMVRGSASVWGGLIGLID